MMTGPKYKQVVLVLTNDIHQLYYYYMYIWATNSNIFFNDQAATDIS